ncbi:alanine/glycine:cation symporter family protein [Speluncibacter jeojiensis]|uniref:Alanine:cation symporter family protein n=1 Tax=Speluncibacter jeojiensis TaxID=2710754 RepID=A0A9X4LZE0_9ACTN|nr:alanine:cation symporter family protein [Corynebacteriales bacterium D3-21]
MDRATDVLGHVNDIWWNVIIVVLVALGLFFTVRTRFVQLRLIPEMVRLIGEKPLDMPDGSKGISSLRAFCVSAASRVGTGNIAGVALAISIGGPGAVFWMWVLAVMGAATAFVESTLGQLYKIRDGDAYRGGPAYYMLHGLRRRWMGVLFAVIITVTYGLVFNAVQSNSIVDAVKNSFGGHGSAVGPIVGIVVAVLAGAVIFGGIHRISAVSQILVPLMAGSYVILGVAVIVLNIGEVPHMIWLIVQNAFGFREVVAGGFGAALMQGVRRGLFSNEAGMGSVPNAGSTAAVSHPAKQGLVQSLGVYFDTILICTTTAFIVLLSEPQYGTAAGASLTQKALSAQLGPWAVDYLTVVIFFLAGTSVIGNYYYGETNIGFLTSARWALPSFRVLVMLCVFAGALASVPFVWGLADLFMGLMALTNLVAIAPLSVHAFRLLDHYVVQRRQGREPTFERSEMPDIPGVQVWDDGEAARVGAG